jgi:hypothetical protein
MSQPIKRKPPFRKLRGYAFDPITSLDLDTVDINETTYTVAWENDLKPGPEGEYIAVVDRDPVSDKVYTPVNLNDPSLLATDGLSPSETNPQFHQQMVYAVVMSTIKNFEQALGRKVLWSSREKEVRGHKQYEYVDKLLVFPHGVRDQNAYYSPDRKVLVFGYYNATPVNSAIYLPGGIVYSCLSHDIVAHETTHALLDGMYSRYMESTHPDVPAFHEGFADLVALLQHFMHANIVRNQIAKVRGDLDSENMLGKLAVEFGQSTGEYSSLRDAIGRMEDGVWKRQKPDVNDYQTIFECHDRGALLVSAVFDAYIAIYKRRTADLLRIATGGSGVISAGNIHPDLVSRLAEEASKTASHVLSMCVRALDYCPPVDMNYGDYLRALITADTELVGDDKYNYRVAFINAFRKRGIFPEGLPNLSVETVCYSHEDDYDNKQLFEGKTIEFFREFKEKLGYVTDRRKIYELTEAFITGTAISGKAGDRRVKGLHDYLFNNKGVVQNARRYEDLTGLVFSSQFGKLGIGQSVAYGRGPSIQIHSLRIHNRISPDGNIQNQLIMTLAQRAQVQVREKNGALHFDPVDRQNAKENRRESMTFRGGCTLIFDLNELKLKHAIRKPIFDPCDIGINGRLKLNTKRLEMQYDCQYGAMAEKMGFAAPGNKHLIEPFACIHQAKNQFI